MEDTDIDHLWWDDQFRKLTEIGLANIIVAVLTNIKGLYYKLSNIEKYLIQ